MARTPEDKAKAAITKTINAVLKPTGIAYSLRNTPAPMFGSAGRPDMMLVLGGLIVEIEAKAGSNGPSGNQVMWLTATASAGGYAWVVWGDSDVDLSKMAENLTLLVTGQKADKLKLTKVKK